MNSKIAFAFSLIGLVVSLVSLNTTKSNGMVSSKINVKGAGYTCDTNSNCVGTDISCQGTASGDNYFFRKYYYNATACRYSYNPFATCDASIPNKPCYETWGWYGLRGCGTNAQATEHELWTVSGCNN